LPQYAGTTQDFITSQIRKSDNECNLIIKRAAGGVLLLVLLICVSVNGYNYYLPENQFKIAQSKVSSGNDIDSAIKILEKLEKNGFIQATQATPLLSIAYYKNGLKKVQSGNRELADFNFEKAIRLGSLESSFELGKMNIEAGFFAAGWELIDSASKSNSPALLKSIIEFYNSYPNRNSDTIFKMFNALSQLKSTGILDFEKYKDSIVTLDPSKIKSYELKEDFLSSEYSFHKGQIVEGFVSYFILVPFLVIEGKLTPTKIDLFYLKSVN
jgi:hypothetical protein